MVFEEVKELEEAYEKLRKKYVEETVKNQQLEKKLKGFENCCKMVIPNKVYTHKKRKNTTVKFLDGSQQTVTRRSGEKDCIETAIAYCVLKQLITAQELKKLIEEREEH